MKSLADRARQRMTVWMAANRGITQTDIANAVGVSQSWVSLYKSGGVEADLDQLEAMARVYGHTLTELLDLRPDPKERALIEAFRALSPENRDLAIRMLEALVPTALPHARHKERR
jgi:transcriptional regulator with XRE-family HTH domain